MNPQDVRGLLAPPGSGLAQYFLRLLSEGGSHNLAIALSTNSTSKALAQEIREATKGLLTLNAVFYESECLRVPPSDEETRLCQEWNLPLRFLRMGKEGKGPLAERGTLYPPEFLVTLLLTNNIACLLSAEPTILNWLSPMGGIGPRPRIEGNSDLSALSGPSSRSLDP